MLWLLYMSRKPTALNRNMRACKRQVKAEKIKGTQNRAVFLCANRPKQTIEQPNGLSDPVVLDACMLLHIHRKQTFNVASDIERTQLDVCGFHAEKKLSQHNANASADCLKRWKDCGCVYFVKQTKKCCCTCRRPEQLNTRQTKKVV